MEIKNLTREKYKEWDQFCLNSDDAWYWHTTDWLEYNLNYQPRLKPESKSLMIVENKEILAICPLILETKKGIKEFTYGGSYGPTPVFSSNLTKKKKEKVMKFLFEHIDWLAKENNVKRVMIKFVILNKSFIEIGEQKFNYLMKFGYLDNLINTQVVDLRRGIEELRSDVRHGHDADIDRAKKNLTAKIYDSKNITLEIYEQYVNLHHKAAGRVTRSKITFDIMHEAIINDNAFLVGVEKDKNFIGFSYFYLYKGNIYYGSSCNDPEAPNLPIAHLMQWRAIEYMKERGCRFYEIGWQNFGSTLSDFPSSKEINIARFKRGFGGFIVPLFRAEKYYNKDYFKKVNKERFKKYINSMN